MPYVIVELLAGHVHCIHVVAKLCRAAAILLLKLTAPCSSLIILFRSSSVSNCTIHCDVITRSRCSRCLRQTCIPLSLTAPYSVTSSLGQDAADASGKRVFLWEEDAWVASAKQIKAANPAASVVGWMDTMLVYATMWRGTIFYEPLTIEYLSAGRKVSRLLEVVYVQMGIT